jgi:hypothetical protein
MGKKATEYTTEFVERKLKNDKRLSRYIDERFAAFIRYGIAKKGATIKRHFLTMERLNPLKDKATGEIKRTVGYDRQRLYNLESGINTDYISIDFIILFCKSFNLTFKDFCVWYAKNYDD